MQAIQVIFELCILFLSVIIHEVSHGYVAYMLGDPTAKLSGRLTLNPISHIDPFGSIALPLVLTLLHLPPVGYAKPVPYNPYMLRGGKWGPAMVAMAGPGVNFLLAIVFALTIRLGTWSLTVTSLLGAIVFVNLVLGLFNSVPIPPLDGSKVLFALLPYQYQEVERFMTRYQLILIFLVIAFLWPFVENVIPFLYSLLTGLPF